MKRKSQYERDLEKIKNMTDPIAAIAALADVMLEIGSDNCSEIQLLGNDVAKIRVSIFGNGNIETSLLHRVAEMETLLSEISKLVVSVNTALCGTVDKPGRMADIERRLLVLEDLRGSINRFVWIIVSALVAEVVAVITAAAVLINNLK